MADFRGAPIFCGFEGLVIKYVRTYLTQLLSNIKWENRELRMEKGEKGPTLTGLGFFLV